MVCAKVHQLCGGRNEGNKMLLTNGCLNFKRGLVGHVPPLPKTRPPRPTSTGHADNEPRLVLALHPSVNAGFLGSDRLVTSAQEAEDVFPNLSRIH